VLLTSFILVGCVSGNIATENPVTPTTTATIFPSASTPTETKIPISAATFIDPTATLYVTPLPTLSADQTWQLLYKTENKCDMPCWWGIIPSISTWTETKQFIEHLSDPSFGYEKVDNEMHITKSVLSETYIWFVWPPTSSSDTVTSIVMEVQNNIVTGIKISGDLLGYFFPIHRLLEEYGEPDKVLVYISNYDASTSVYKAFIYVVYEKKHILAYYLYFGPETTDLVNLCLHELNEQDMFLWAPNTELTIDFSALKPLDEYSKLNPTTFYERFKDQKNKCFEISRDAWN